MLLIGGVIAVIVAVAGGYLWEGGHLMLLWQPAEFLIIAGCAAGILLISTPMAVLGALSEQTKRLFTPPPRTVSPFGAIRAPGTQGCRTHSGATAGPAPASRDTATPGRAAAT